MAGSWAARSWPRDGGQGESGNDVLQLAHVAGPVVARQCREHAVSHRRGAADAGGGGAPQVFGKQRDVLGPFAQRRQMDADHVEAVQQILTEPAGRTFGADVAIGGADERTSTLRLKVSPTRRNSCSKSFHPRSDRLTFGHIGRKSKAPCLTEQATLTICSAPAAKRVPAIAQNC